MTRHGSRRRPVPLLIVAVAALGLAACAPAKKAPPAAAPPPPGLFIAYYLSSSSGGMGGDDPLQRSAAPTTRTLTGGATVTHALRSDGSVAMTVVSPPKVINVSFYTVPVSLGDLSTITVQRAPGTTNALNLSLLLDVDGDGDFGEWSAGGVFQDLGTDAVGTGPETGGGTLTVGGSTPFEIDGAGGGTWTLEQLKAGASAGVNAATSAAILVDITLGGDGSELVTSLRLNGSELLLP